MSQVRNANIASAATTYSERPAFRSDTCEWVTGALTMQNQTNTHTNTPHMAAPAWADSPGRQTHSNTRVGWPYWECPEAAAITHGNCLPSRLLYSKRHQPGRKTVTYDLQSCPATKCPLMAGWGRLVCPHLLKMAPWFPCTYRQLTVQKEHWSENRRGGSA